MPARTLPPATPTKKTSRFRRPSVDSAGPSSQNATTTTPTAPSATSASLPVVERSMRRIAKLAIRTMPTGSAAARQTFEISSAGVVMARSSAAYCHAGQITSARKARQAAIATASSTARGCGESRPTSAVMRMCSPRRSAVTAPSIASQRKRMDASSSDQTSGRCKTKRENTPAKRTTMSASTSRPAGTSTSQPSARSRRASRAWPPAFTPLERLCRSRQLAGVALQDRPGVVAELRLPLGVEAGLPHAVAKSLGLRRVEGQALCCEILLQAGVERGDVDALLHAGGVDVAGDDQAQVFGQALPGLAVGEEPEAVPHVVGHRAVLLHFVELGRGDDGERVFLAVDDLRLQRAVDLAEIDRCRRGVEGLEHRGPQRRDRDADLEALQIVGRLDRLGRRRDLAKAVVPDALHRDQVRLGDLPAHVGAEVAVEGLPHGVVVAEREADAGDGRSRDERGEDEPREREELDAAGAHLAQHLSLIHISEPTRPY